MSGPKDYASPMPGAIAFYRRALAYFRDDRGPIAASMSIILAMNLLGVIWPVPMAIFFSVMSGKGTQTNWLYRLFDWVPRGDVAHPEPQVRFVLYLAGITLVLRLLNEFLRTWQTQLSIGIGYRGRARVQAELFQKLQALSLKYHKAQPQGDGIYRLSYDTSGFQGVLNIVLGYVVNAGALVVMLITMLSLNWKLTLIALLVVPLLWITITQWSKTLYRFAMAQKGRSGSDDADPAIARRRRPGAGVQPRTRRARPIHRATVDLHRDVAPPALAGDFLLARARHDPDDRQRRNLRLRRRARRPRRDRHRRPLALHRLPRRPVRPAQSPHRLERGPAEREGRRRARLRSARSRPDHHRFAARDLVAGEGRGSSSCATFTSPIAAASRC